MKYGAGALLFLTCLAACEESATTLTDGGDSGRADRDGAVANRDGGSVGLDAGGPDPCASTTCADHARCVAPAGAPTCVCAPGYEGDGITCSAVLDPCIAAGTCPEGEWTQRLLPGISGDDTIQTVLVDPVRPSDFYAFGGSNGGGTIKVYVSTDFGETWENRNTTAGITGNPWGASIDPNPSRDPGTPPTLWSPSGYGANGAWRSTDGGRTFQRSTACDTAFEPYNPSGATDLYHIAILPDDPPNHVLATYHYGFRDADGGFGETWDGGETWVIHPPPDDVGTSHYVIPISGTTWAVIAQDNDNRNGIWRTTTAGRIGGTPGAMFRDGTISTDAWTMVDPLEHAHGSHQNLILPDGRILVTGNTNGAVSDDQGATFTHFTESNAWAPPHQFESSQMTNIAATDRFVYTNFMANRVVARAPLDNLIGEVHWENAYVEMPAAYAVGGAPFGMASAYNPSAERWLLIAGGYDGTMWKYVEPPE